MHLIGDVLSLGWLDRLATGDSSLKVAVGLGFVIFVHELGHFLVAKACGVKCEKFYLGFDIVGLQAVPASTGAKPNTASASCRWAAT